MKLANVLIAIATLVAVLCGIRAYANQLPPQHTLRTEGSLATGAVSVFFGHVYFGQLVCQDTFTGPTVIFASSVSRPHADFAMNVEFLREIVQISDVEHTKAPCKAEAR